MEALVEGGHGAQASSRFFANTFVNENVRINRDADAENDTSDTRQCKRRSDKAQRGEGQQGVQQKCDVGNCTPYAIKELDEDGYENEADDACNETHLDGVAAQIRPNGTFFDNG
ncbi:hypothetical protein D3C80_1104940 [compost metagenome]